MCAPWTDMLGVYIYVVSWVMHTDADTCVDILYVSGCRFCREKHMLFIDFLTDIKSYMNNWAESFAIWYSVHVQRSHLTFLYHNDY